MLHCNVGYGFGNIYFHPDEDEAPLELGCNLKKKILFSCKAVWQQYPLLKHYTNKI